MCLTRARKKRLRRLWRHLRRAVGWFLLPFALIADWLVSLLSTFCGDVQWMALPLTPVIAVATTFSAVAVSRLLPLACVRALGFWIFESNTTISNFAAQPTPLFELQIAVRYDASCIYAVIQSFLALMIACSVWLAWCCSYVATYPLIFSVVLWMLGTTMMMKT